MPTLKTGFSGIAIYLAGGFGQEIKNRDLGSIASKFPLGSEQGDSPVVHL